MAAYSVEKLGATFFLVIPLVIPSAVEGSLTG